MKKLVLLFGLLPPIIAFSQQYSVDWYKTAGGSGASTNGKYSVSGTIGQAEAGAMRGGNYSLASGFWSIVAQKPGPPRLSITRSNTSVILSWPLSAGDFVLDDSPTFVGSPPPWTQVPAPYVTNGTTISFIEPLGLGNRFYRLHKP